MRRCDTLCFRASVFKNEYRDTKAQRKKRIRTTMFLDVLALFLSLQTTL